MEGKSTTFSQGWQHQSNSVECEACLPAARDECEIELTSPASHSTLFFPLISRSCLAKADPLPQTTNGTMISSSMWRRNPVTCTKSDSYRIHIVFPSHQPKLFSEG
jgi:hypothetical protein